MWNHSIRQDLWHFGYHVKNISFYLIRSGEPVTDVNWCITCSDLRLRKRLLKRWDGGTEGLTEQGGDLGDAAAVTQGREEGPEARHGLEGRNHRASQWCQSPGAKGSGHLGFPVSGSGN